MKTRFWLWVGVFLLSGCMSRFRQAEELSARQRYTEAAALLEQLYRENPNNPDLRRTLERTRFLAVEFTLGKARGFRLSGDAEQSMRHFAEGLSMRQKWNVKLNGALESTVEDEREEATRRLRSVVAPLVQKGAALAAEVYVRRHDFLLENEELSALRREFGDAVAAAGATTCRKLKTGLPRSEPHYTALVVRYCRHFQQGPPDGLPLTEAFARLSGTVNVSELSPGMSGQLEEALMASALASPWQDTNGRAQARFEAAGTYSQVQRQGMVPLVAQWTEQVPFEVEVMKTLTDSVPVQECEVQETRSANGQKLVRAKEVTRQKQRTKQVVVKETRFRSVPRTFPYSATRVERSLSYSLKMRLWVSDEAVAAAGDEGQEQASGYHHDIRFDPAGVRPQRVQFEPADLWFSEGISESARVFSKALSDSWRQRFCAGPSFTPEEAARCLRAVNGIPAPAIEALRTRLKDDAPEAGRLFQ